MDIHTRGATTDRKLRRGVLRNFDGKLQDWRQGDMPVYENKTWSCIFACNLDT